MMVTSHIYRPNGVLTVSSACMISHIDGRIWIAGLVESRGLYSYFKKLELKDRFNEF